MKVITNNHKRPILSGWEIPESILEDDFSYCSEDSLFFKYRDQYYALDEFMRTDIDGWDGIFCDSFFSGILIRIYRDEYGYEDPDFIVVGTFIS